MTPLWWYVFWVGFWSDLARLEHRRTAEIISFEDWKRAHPPRQPLPPRRAA